MKRQHIGSQLEEPAIYDVYTLPIRSVRAHRPFFPQVMQLMEGDLGQAFTPWAPERNTEPRGHRWGANWNDPGLM